MYGGRSVTDFDEIVLFLEKALNDNINKVKSSIMGSLKKTGEKILNQL